MLITGKPVGEAVDAVGMFTNQVVPRGHQSRVTGGIEPCRPGLGHHRIDRVFPDEIELAHDCVGPGVLGVSVDISHGQLHFLRGPSVDGHWFAPF